ncbi:MAG: hypothetical protein COU10_00220 [Candidatus Harrisonbacteria bacterium CG10_big_fil_rev_8_21_14_0_10_45_28]|uniref:Uncharacterized protein n=1 Tax=Candidatus Harrisonbacteria bacterium CG10_big_fil_rev_8_21_14_0_10_45_28 TaxID=1974586 RepID=A0A2H0UP96_9BACT|nr:MAG: hypothetical protein COU10_00220 [Candidatus Harrisonbacteria bacterium CG10_big_fil_rev_8_21_14_0_10_45_28]
MLEQYWTEKETAVLDQAEEYKDLLAGAMPVINRMPTPIAQVCGPLTSGGSGSMEENMAVMQSAIDKLRSDGKNIFNQLPFEKPMQRLRNKLEPGKYSTRLLADFYLPIFNSGKITTLYFLSNWETSTGTRWEREQGEKLGLEIVDLDENFNITSTTHPLSEE